MSDYKDAYETAMATCGELRYELRIARTATKIVQRRYDQLMTRVQELEEQLLVDLEDVGTKLQLDRDRYRSALEESVNMGHNDDCLFCGFKDRIATEALGEVSDE